MIALDRSFFSRSALDVAPDLLGIELRFGQCAGRIVEVEAYMGADDPASHCFRGRTRRNAVMFGPAGHLYVYFTYGMHWCANVVTGGDGDGQAVLLRAIEPTAGLAEMRARRAAARRDVDLTNGPAKLCAALGIDGRVNGADLLRGPVVLAGSGSAGRAVVTTRIGISVATENPWRWYLAGNPHVSRRTDRGTE